MNISLYSDESIYSIYARIAFYSGKFKIRKENLNSVIDYPFKSVENPDGTSLSQKIDGTYLLERHSSYPYYSQFMLNNEEREQMKKTFLEGNSLKIDQLTGHFKSKSNLRLCPLCLVDDSNRYGEPYWHRAHQLPGSIVCDIHNILLLSECPKCSEPLTPSSKHLPLITPQFCSEGHCLKHVIPNEDEDLLTLATNNRSLLEPEKKVDLIKIREKMTTIFLGEGIINEKSYYRFKLNQKVHERFNDSFLKRLGISKDVMRIHLFWKTRKELDPLFYILLMIYFSGSVFQFLEQEFEYAPFGNGPWKCLNRVCKYYEKHVIKSVEISFIKGGRPWALFCCNECGCKYEWLNYDDVALIIEPGPVWLSECEKLFQNWEVTFNEMYILFTRDFMDQWNKYHPISPEHFKSKCFSKSIKEEFPQLFK
ncbi:TnsD family Tn7-like transposition protein [Paenibacillus typhae]|uniref:TniQ protein n=1 Tax=Paenibacillus typhae TaxID=1174501 RepID=A0A1G8QP82_9BACL|nr:TnsD family Tn7-like transposition protein [Paenibacillus typhae]SDJ06564.1 TniQ protein [Paenibacillus typhae]